MISTAIVNPNQEEQHGGLFPEDVANRVPMMIRTLVYCWIGLSALGIAMFFPYQQKEVSEEERKLTGTYSRQSIAEGVEEERRVLFV